MKYTLRFLTLAVFGFASLSINAAEISWGPTFDLTSDALIDTTGEVAIAVNVNNGTVDPIDVNGITFGSDQLTFASGTGQGNFFTGGGGTTGNANLDAVLDSHGWAGGETAIPITGLTPGGRYQVQLIGAADTRGCCGARNQAANDGMGNATGDMSRMGPGSVIGRFVADSDTQIVNVVPGSVDGVDPGLSAGIVSVLPDTNTISINFASEEPAGAGSAVTGAAGVLGSSHWNNLEAANGSADNLVDQLGLATSASVSWVSNNTWASQGRSEDNNSAPEGNDRNLMTGYLDTNGTDPNSVTVSGLPFDGEYDVIVYTKGGVIGRGGEYTIGDQTISHVDAAPFSGTFVEGAEGDYIKFSGVSGGEFTLSGLPTVGNPPRAPINGIEITTVPEPSTVVLMGLGLLSLVSIRRRK